MANVHVSLTAIIILFSPFSSWWSESYLYVTFRFVVALRTPCWTTGLCEEQGYPTPSPVLVLLCCRQSLLAAWVGTWAPENCEMFNETEGSSGKGSKGWAGHLSARTLVFLGPLKLRPTSFIQKRSAELGLLIPTSPSWEWPKAFKSVLQGP